MVAQKLAAMGYAPVSIKAKNAGVKRESKFPASPRRCEAEGSSGVLAPVRDHDRLWLVAVAGPQHPGEQTDNPTLAATLAEVRTDVETGNALSSSMARHPNVFPPLMVNMTKAGEIGGFLDETMLQIAANYESEVGCAARSSQR